VRSIRVSPWCWLVAVLFGCGGPANPATPAASLDDIDRDLAASCSAPDAVTACAPAAFCKTASRWKSGGCDTLDKNRRVLSDRWLKAIEVNAWQTAYGLAHLDVDSALPALRAKLVGSADRYGWDDSEPGQEGDARYPHAMALIVAIEALSKRRAAEYVALTADEQERLEREAQLGDDRAAASGWLLKKLHR
jgi:hypothetical protein